MIIGIDETGDFRIDSDKYNFFIAILIDQNLGNYEIKKQQFEFWENSISDSYRDSKGEVKGQKLEDTHLEDFYLKVLEPSPNILYSIVQFNTLDNPVELVFKHKEYEIKSLEKALKHYEEEAFGNWASGYNKILAWYKNRNYQQIVKIKCLDYLIGQTFNYGFLYSQVRFLIDKDDKNIRNFSFKIDRDFINAENTKDIWNELLRQFWFNYNQSNKIPIIDIIEKEKNPAFKEYNFSEGESNLKKVFRDRTKFLHSEEHFEIRMADIVGTILHRAENKKRCVDIAKKIKKQLGGKKENYMELRLNEVK